MDVEVKKPTQEELKNLRVDSWPMWEKEESSFDWYYDEKEVCYFLEGEVQVECADGKCIEDKKGDLATFPQGLRCKWHVKKRVKKHYNFG